MKPFLSFALCWWLANVLLAGCAAFEPGKVSPPNEHSVLVLPPEVEKRIAALEQKNAEQDDEIHCLKRHLFDPDCISDRLGDAETRLTALESHPPVTPPKCRSKQ